MKARPPSGIGYSTVSLGPFTAGLSGPFVPMIYHDNPSGRWIASCVGSRRATGDSVLKKRVSVRHARQSPAQLLGFRAAWATSCAD
jgi:hypothetical protein